MNLSIWYLIKNADLTVKLVLLMLAVVSVTGWAIIIEKFISLKLQLKKSWEFENYFHSGITLSDLYSELKNDQNNLIVKVFVAGLEEGGRDKSEHSHTNAQSAMQVQAYKAVAKLEKNLNFLAISSSASPFIGLFGTVWGIMHSFQAIGAANSVSLPTIAPSIAEALFATAAGLIVAIPAAIFYNWFYNSIDTFKLRVNNLITEMTLILAKKEYR